MRNLGELTKEQRKAFNSLKRAYKNCIDAGIFFVNQYGSLTAFNGGHINGFGIEDNFFSDPSHAIPMLGTSVSQVSFQIPHEWCDDEGMHRIGLTELGYKIYTSSPSQSGVSNNLHEPER